MLYLLNPHRTMRWVDLPAKPVLDVARAGNDLSGIKWLDTDPAVIASPAAVRLAIRHGVACAGGLAIEAHYIITLNRPALLRATNAAAAQSQADVAAQHGKFFEEVQPGWTERHKSMQAGIDASMQHEIDAAEAETARALSAPVDADLAGLWRSLGGVIPET